MEESLTINIVSTKGISNLHAFVFSNVVMIMSNW